MAILNKDRALVLFSGGQDSAICLAWALDRYSRVETLGFDYGQRHDVELEARAAIRRELVRHYQPWADKLADDTLINLPALKDISTSALTDDIEICLDQNGVPSTFVPGRNLIFLTMAGAYAYNRKIMTIIGGMCEADFSGYPDCREETLEAQMKAFNLGTDSTFILETPLMHLTKSQSWHLAEKIGGEQIVRIINEYSHTCYRGVRDKKNLWGYGCDYCPACALRKNGWDEYAQQRRHGNGGQ